MKWNFSSRLIRATFCLELAKDKFNRSALGEDDIHQYAWDIYPQIDVEYSPLDNFILFTYKDQQILRVPLSRITIKTDIKLSEDEADKAITMIALIDQLQVEPTYYDLEF